MTCSDKSVGEIISGYQKRIEELEGQLSDAMSQIEAMRNPIIRVVFDSDGKEVSRSYIPICLNVKVECVTEDKCQKVNSQKPS